MKNTISEMRNTLQGITSQVAKTEDQISNLEGNEAENNQKSKKKKESEKLCIFKKLLGQLQA